MHHADPPRFAAGARETRHALHAVYALYALSFLLGATALAAVIIAYLKRSEAAGTVYASHVVWAIRTFWVLIVVGAVGAALAFVVIGVPILFLLGIWLIYRIVKGWVRLAEDRPIENPDGLF